MRQLLCQFGSSASFGCGQWFRAARESHNRVAGSGGSYGPDPVCTMQRIRVISLLHTAHCDGVWALLCASYPSTSSEVVDQMYLNGGGGAGGS